MGLNNQIFAVRPSSTPETVSLDLVWTQGDGGGLDGGYTSATPIPADGSLALLAYDKTAQRTDVYALSPAEPWVKRVGSGINLDGGPWDTVDNFVLGNERYLLTYRTEDGTFGFFRLGKDFSVSASYKVQMLRNTPTTGFTTVAPFTSLSGQYILGYNFNDGTVAAFSVTVTPSSPPNVPPLLFLNVWYHHWARGWTRFAFFQMGGANFFFKINTAKLNVNIDHLRDNPAAGTVEVGSFLQSQLPDALSIDVAASLPWSHGEPYFLAYMASSGATKVYHIHADCLGWTQVAARATVAGASLIVPYRLGDATYALFYGTGK